MLEFLKSSRSGNSHSLRSSIAQIILGVIPALYSVFLLVLFTSEVQGPKAGLHRVHIAFALAGSLGLLWGAIPSPRWAVWPILGLLACGYVAVWALIGPVTLYDLVTSVSAFLIVFPLVAGPMVVGAYQATRLVSRLRHERKVSLGVA